MKLLAAARRLFGNSDGTYSYARGGKLFTVKPKAKPMKDPRRATTEIIRARDTVETTTPGQVFDSYTKLDFSDRRKFVALLIKEVQRDGQAFEVDEQAWLQDMEYQP